MKNNKKEQICNQNTQDPDFYEAAYQRIKNKITLKYQGICESELRRMTMAEIRRNLRFHIPLEDIDMHNYRKWTVGKRMEWLYDLQMFVFKTLGKNTIKELRGIR